MLKHLIAGLIKNNVTSVDLHNLSEWDIKPCAGCSHCWFVTPSKCIAEDDFTKETQNIFKSDILIFASPIWAGSGTHLFKIFIERIYSILNPLFVKVGENYGHKKISSFTTSKMYLLSNCALPGKQNFDAIINNLICLQHLCDFNFKGAILKDQSLELKFAPQHKIEKLFELIEQAGFELLADEVKFLKICDDIAQPLMDTDTYINMCNEDLTNRMK